MSCANKTKFKQVLLYATPAWKYCAIYTRIQAITEWIL